MSPVPPADLSGMREYWLAPERLFDGRDLRSGFCLHVKDGAVRAVVPAGALPEGAPVRRLDGLLTPGFFDLQVNGGGGVLLNSSPTAQGLATIGQAHRSFGTEGLMATLITDRPEVLDRVVAAVPQAVGHDGIVGLHIEGPHISPARPGVHAAEFIRPFDQRSMTAISTLRTLDIPVLITLAPETLPPGTIARIVETGARVSIGHSQANPDEVARALDEGASLFTHLFNAMPPMLGREPGVVAAAILSEACCSIIADGFHVAPQMLRLAIRARPVADRMILVSDAMPTVGGPPSFDLYGQTITARGGRLVNADGSLAGADTTMLASLRNAVEMLGQDLETALRMAITNPAALMGLSAQFTLGQDYAGDLLHLDQRFGMQRLAMAGQTRASAR
jgi:N-acetylglucosamine-6-phosphate deacetylase